MRLKRISVLCMVSVLGWGISCQPSSYSLVAVRGGRYEVTSVYDDKPDSAALAILMPYKLMMDSLTSPVVGLSAVSMTAERPESLLSNLVADVLREESEKYAGMKSEIALVNMGALRAALPEGEVTYGDIYQILPFENTINIVTLTGVQLKRLFENIASRGGEGISGVRMLVSPRGELLEFTVDRKPVDEHRKYNVATIDYLVEGNDGMSALTLSSECFQLEGVTLRQLFMDYVADLYRQGRRVSSGMDGRITIKCGE